MHPSSFAERVKTFNGKLIPRATIAVSPLDAEDVSAVIRFCRKHDLSPSVKAGGYGIAGWSVAGDIVIDMSLIRDIDIETPLVVEEGTIDYTRLKDMPSVGSKGKARAAGSEIATVADGALPVPVADPKPSGTKRSREDDEEDTPAKEPQYKSPLDDPTLRNYDGASHAVAEFLKGPALPEEKGEAPRQPPTNKRRLHSPEREDAQGSQLVVPPLTARQHSGESATSSGAGSSTNSGSHGGSSISRSGSADTEATTPTENPWGGSSESTNLIAHRPTGATDPFGYMTGSSSSMAMPPYLSSNRAFSGPSGIMSGMSPAGFMPNFPMNIGAFSLSPNRLGGIAPPRPVHSHAYVTFGAGLRQKEIDMYTADNALEGVSSVTGAVENALVPYHVPT